MFYSGDSMEIEISPATPEKEWSPGPEVNSDFFLQTSSFHYKTTKDF